MRMEFIKDMHPEYNRNKLIEISKAVELYFQNGYQSGSYQGFFCLTEKGDIAGTAGMLLYSLPPLSVGKPRSIGHILNFFIREQYRRMGYGSQLMEFVKESAKQDGLDRIVLNATDMGFGLYKKAGFEIPEDCAMKFEIKSK